MSFEDEELEMNKEIPRGLLSRLITWLRNNGHTDTEIVECTLHICNAEFVEVDN